MLGLKRFAIASLCLFTSHVHSDPEAAPLGYRGSAFDTERGVPAYTEDHQERYLQGKLVLSQTFYKAVDGKPIGERSLDFSRFEYKPGYLFKDVRNGYEEGSVAEDADLLVHFRDSTKAPLHEKRLKVPEPCVVNGGLGPFLKRHWADLEAGKRLAFNMVVPARLDYFRFMAYEDAKSTLPEKETGGRISKAVVIEPQSSLLRMLLPAIIMHYDVKTLRLVRYQGIVNVADAKGRSLRVKVDYPGLGP